MKMVDDTRFIRTEVLVGEAGIKKLFESKVAIFGLGGVGGHVCEALARGGIGNFILVDKDIVSVSNINRQIIATDDTVGRYKTEVMQERIRSINPNCNVKIYNTFYLPSVSGIIEEDTNYIVDAIDTVSGKIQLVIDANNMNIPIMSSMGTGNKLEPTMLEVSDIYKTSMCPLAKVMRKELKNLNIEKLKVVYSKEKPRDSKLPKEEMAEEMGSKRGVVGSVSFVPSVAGLIIASEVIKDLLKGVI